MAILLPHIPTFAVALIYLFWAVYCRRQQRRRKLCERVAFMLWTSALPAEEEEEDLPVEAASL